MFHIVYGHLEAIPHFQSQVVFFSIRLVVDHPPVGIEHEFNLSSETNQPAIIYQLIE